MKVKRMQSKYEAAKADREETLIKRDPISKDQWEKSKLDFEKNFKPLFEDLEEWRKESSSSLERIC